MVSIPGGEPLMHPQIDKIVKGLVARKKYIYLCTNALLLKEKIHLFQPSKYLTFSVHVDGQREHSEHFKQIVDDVKTAGFKQVLLLGMGGSSLAPEVWKKTFGKIAGFPELHVLDSTVPAQVKAFELGERRQVLEPLVADVRAVQVELAQVSHAHQVRQRATGDPCALQVEPL